MYATYLGIHASTNGAPSGGGHLYVFWGPARVLPGTRLAYFSRLLDVVQEEKPRARTRRWPEEEAPSIGGSDGRDGHEGFLRHPLGWHPLGRASAGGPEMPDGRPPGLRKHKSENMRPSRDNNEPRPGARGLVLAFYPKSDYGLFPDFDGDLAEENASGEESLKLYLWTLGDGAYTAYFIIHDDSTGVLSADAPLQEVLDAVCGLVYDTFDEGAAMVLHPFSDACQIVRDEGVPSLMVPQMVMVSQRTLLPGFATQGAAWELSKKMIQSVLVYNISEEFHEIVTSYA